MKLLELLLIIGFVATLLLDACDCKTLFHILYCALVIEIINGKVEDLKS